MDAPDMSQQMAELNKPTAAENAQHKLGVAAQQDYMRDIIGTTRRPGAASRYSDWVEYGGSPQAIEFQKGQAVGTAQMGFNGAKLLRAAAVNRLGGSGLGEGALRQGYSAFGSTKSGGVAGVAPAVNAQLNRNRLGIAKIGQGMNDAVISGYQNLGQQQTAQRQTALGDALASAERSMYTQAGLIKTGLQVGGTLSSAAAGSWNGKNEKDADGNPLEEGAFNWDKFGSNLLDGYTQGLYGGM